MKEVIKKINTVFIKLILIFFYVFIIGIGALIQKVFKIFTTKNKKSTFWVNEQEKDINYFRSPY